MKTAHIRRYREAVFNLPVPEGKPELNELRGLRDAYGARAALALKKRFLHLKPANWDRFIESVSKVPIGQVEGLLLLADFIADIGDWAAVTRFAVLAERVWNLEVEVLAKQQCRWGKDSE